MSCAATCSGSRWSLRERLDAGRVTIRVDDAPGETFPVKAEACADAVAPIAGHRTEGIRESDTFRWIERERSVLVQDDIAASPIAPAAVLLERYGARAQLLAPVVRDGAVAAIVSVHETRDVRAWRADEADEAAAAAARGGGRAQRRRALTSTVS